VPRPAWAQRPPIVFAMLKWAGIALATVLVLVLGALILLDGNQLKKPIERMASARSGREVSIGSLAIHPWSWTPSAVVDGLRIGNPPWEGTRPMAQIGRLTVRLKLLPLLKGDVILPQVLLEKPRVYLHRERSGRANWTFANTRPSDARAPEPPNLPVIRDFLIQGGELKVVDEMRKLDFDASVQAHEKASKDDPKPFRIEGKGKLNDEPLRLQVAGGPLVNLDPDEPYPFDLSLRAGNLEASATGTVTKPFDLGQLKFNVKASGHDLADLYYLSQLALPNTPPFVLTALVQRDGRRVSVTDIAGTVGSSDVGGKLSVDLSRKRPLITGDLRSKHLRLRDLGAALGADAGGPGSIEPKGPDTEPSAKRSKDKEPPADVPRLFPEARLQVERVRGMDADVRFAAHSIDAGKLPLKEVSFHVKLDSGVLSIAPFAFELPQGQLSGSARIDARRAVPRSEVEVRIRNIQLDQLKGKAPDAKPPLAGELQGRAVLKGSGDSVHAFMSGANGTVTIVLPRGEIRAAFAELTGINVSRGLGLLLTKDEDRAQIRCGLADFAVQDGTMHTRKVVFDTHNVLIKGSGEIRLGPEELDLAIKGEPKKLRLLRLRTPIEINGHLRQPSFGVNAGKTITQGAVATALAVVAMPVAAMLAFVDPGTAKDANCSQLLAQQ
jgi:AsmA family protein